MPENKTQFTVVAFGVIFDEKGRVLLVHRRDYDLWNLPGGNLETGESPVEGVKREVKEETGFDVEIIKLFAVYNKLGKNSINFSFLCRITGGEATLNDEADQIEYFEIDKIPKNTVPKHVDSIMDALLNLKEITFKTQTGKSAIQLIKEGKL
ncbi:MAG: NUDIX domain-containing protein [Minisyncoccia bacterium]